MNWNKAGRPRKRPQTEVQNRNEQDTFTKQDLYVYTDPLLALACSVVKQWKEDGSPEADLPGILPWLMLIKDKTGV